MGSIATAAAFLAFGQRWLADLSNPLWFAFLLFWLFGVVLFSAFAVVRHAEVLAVKLGEPLGTLVLTLSVTGIEVMMIAAVMYTAEGGSSLARDAMFAVVMIVLNGMVGSVPLAGRLAVPRTDLQSSRRQRLSRGDCAVGRARPYPAELYDLVPGPTLSPFQAVFLIVMSIGLYGVFLAIQNLRHRNYFVSPESDDAAAGPPHGEGDACEPALWGITRSSC